jgi:hypothetical protein
MISYRSSKSYPNTIKECLVPWETQFWAHLPVDSVMEVACDIFIFFEQVSSKMEVVVYLTRDDNLIQRIELAGMPCSLPYHAHCQVHVLAGGASRSTTTAKKIVNSGKRLDPS